MKIALAALYTQLILLLVIVDREQGNPMVRVIKDSSPLDLMRMRMRRDFIDYEDLNGQVRGFNFCRLLS